jgi:glycosyltransferase involved in cell wall biosynthesis
MLPGIVGGTETYAEGLVRGLASIDSSEEYVVFVNRESAGWPLPQSSRFTRVVCPINATSRLKRYAYEQFLFPRLLKKHKIDIVHSLGYVCPVFVRCPSVVTIHDLNFLALRDTLPLSKKIFLRLFATQSARRSSRVITISEFSKKEICSRLKINEKKVIVTHEAPKEKAQGDISEEWASLELKYGLHDPYLVAFAGGGKHKNIKRLIESFADVSKDCPQNLVLIGRNLSDADISDPKIQFIRHRIILTGYVPENHILPILGHADLFVMPSMYEGFGLPVVDAQAAGTAVACSAIGSLPEIAGKGAVYFDPFDIGSIASAIRGCLSDGELRSKLRLLGSENVKRFSWKETTLKTMEVYYDIAALREVF